MSYILDALRKSDQLRQRGAAPTLLLAPAPAAASKQPAPLFYGLLALALLGAGMAIGWLRPWQPEPVAPAPVAVAARPLEPRPSLAPALRPEMAQKTGSQLHEQKSAPAPQAVSVPAPAPALAPAQVAAGVKIDMQSGPPKAVAEVPKKAPPLPDQATSSSGGAAGAAPLPAAMAMAELPLAIQQELPSMSISVHAYSGNAAERLVGINSRLLHEGEYVAPDLKLEQITFDGMILSYKGYTFRRGVK